MGSSASTRINEFIKIDPNLQLTTIHELDQLIIVAQDLIKVTEQLRCRIVSYYDLMFRIVKLHLYKDMKLANAFKVWYMCALVCNDSKEKGVPFECKVTNFDSETLSEEMKKFLIYGSIVAFAIDDKFVKDEKEQLIKCDTGICGDFKLQLWPHILNSFLCYLRSSLKLVPYLEEQLNQQITLIRKQLEINKTNKLIKVINPDKLTFLIDQLKLFKATIFRYHDEVKEFTSQYINIMEESHPLCQDILREEGNQNYILNDDRTILKTKIQDIIKRYLPNYEVKGFTDLLEERKLKENRRKVKPKIKLERRRTEQAAMTFPTQYHWIGHEYYDTLFSAQSLALSELEEARQQGEEARKKLFKKTGVNQWRENTMKSVFECLTWVLSAEFHYQLQTQDFKLLNQEPFLHFKHFKKHKFSEQSKPLVERLQIWLKYFSPSRFDRISHHYSDFQRRQERLEKDKFEFHHQIRDLNPQNQYNALSSFSKNYRINETYLPKIQKLFEFTIKYNGKMGESLYACWQDLVNEADEKKYELNTPFNEFLQKFRPHTLAEVNELENRKIERRQTKLSIACIEI